MDRDHILAELDRLRPWLHQIDLGNGLFTKTESAIGEAVDHPADTWQTIKRCLPDDLTGKTVLDAGCNAGFYSIEAKRRGAARVLGVDGQRLPIRQAVFVRRLLGLDIEYCRLNVYELTRRRIGQFDITLALGLLYHLKHPMLALENLYQVTRDLLIIETAIMPKKRTPPPFQHRLGRLHPFACIENPVEAKEQVANWFLPSVTALTALLRNTGFDETEVVEVKDDRAVLVCRKLPRSVGEDSVARSKVDVSHHYVAALTLVDGPTTCRAKDELSFKLCVENIGLEPWPAGAKPVGERGPMAHSVDEGLDSRQRDYLGVVRLGAHLLRSSEEEVAWDYARADLPRDLVPGEAVEVELKARAPELTGDYIIEFDMLAEYIFWFEDLGSGTLRHVLLNIPA
jgi:tRNA (mo5U34)-methyltransferase